MVEKISTDPPLEPRATSTLEDSTRDIGGEAFSIDFHRSYLDTLQKQFNIEVNHAIIFYLSAQSDPIIFTDREEIVVGRQDANGRIQPEFDLSKFDGAENGISRLHAKIIWEDGSYHIQDLHSTNGTRLNGQKLVPYQYAPLTDSSILQFGRLMMNVFIATR